MRFYDIVINKKIKIDEETGYLLSKIKYSKYGKIENLS
jgi:hypothetical protein